MGDHPEDVETERQSTAEATKYGPGLLVEHTDELRQLLLVYSDARAEENLVELRSWFWGEALPSAVAKGGGA